MKYSSVLHSTPKYEPKPSKSLTTFVQAITDITQVVVMPGRLIDQSGTSSFRVLLGASSMDTVSDDVPTACYNLPTLDEWYNSSAVWNTFLGAPVEAIHYGEHMTALLQQNQVLMEQVTELEKRVLLLEENLPETKVVVLQQASKEEAKCLVRQLFDGSRALYYSDIAQELGLELQTVVEICDELQAEGEIARGDRLQE